MKTAHSLVVWFVFTMFVIVTVHGGLISVDEQSTNELLAESWTEQNGTGKNHEEADINLVVDSRSGKGTKDSMLPLISAVVLKLVLLIPLFLTTMGLIAGFSLATSKVALLLGGGLSLYYYLRESQLLTPLTKEWKHPVPSVHLPHSYTHPEFPEDLQRDRISVRRIYQKTSRRKH